MNGVVSPAGIDVALVGNFGVNAVTGACVNPALVEGSHITGVIASAIEGNVRMACVAKHCSVVVAGERYIAKPHSRGGNIVLIAYHGDF